MRPRIIRLFFLGFLALVSVGCTARVPSVDGKIVDGGKGYSPKADEQVSVNLTSEDGTRSFSGKAEPDGSFSVQSSDGKGIPVGKYKVTVSIYHLPTAGAKGPPTPPVTKDTGETYEVSKGGGELNVDLAKATVDTTTGKEPKKKKK